MIKDMFVMKDYRVVINEMSSNLDFHHATLDGRINICQDKYPDPDRDIWIFEVSGDGSEKLITSRKNWDWDAF